MANAFYTNTIDLVAFTKARAGDVEANFSAVEAGFDGVASAIAAAQSYAGAPAFDATTNYTNGFVVFSMVDRQLYRRNSAGTSATDPSADPTNWTRVVIGLPVVTVTGTSQTALSNYQYTLTNVAATTVTLPASPVVGDKVIVKPANGLATNVVARNGSTIEGLAEDMTIDSAFAVANLQFLNGSWRLV